MTMISKQTINESYTFKGVQSFSPEVTTHVKLSSVKYGNLDAHGNSWNDRVVCKVVAYDRTANKIIVQNSNGLEWVSDLFYTKSNYKGLQKWVFCDKNGNA